MLFKLNNQLELRLALYLVKGAPLPLPLSAVLVYKASVRFEKASSATQTIRV